MSREIFTDFGTLYETVQLKNFEDKVSDKLQFKKAVKVADAPKIKKAVRISRALKKGPRFTKGKPKRKGFVIHYTNAKNSFKRAQKRKSIKGMKK